MKKIPESVWKKIFLWDPPTEMVQNKESPGSIGEMGWEKGEER